MPVGPEIRFKVTPDEYRYLEGLAKFYYITGLFLSLVSIP
jgi:hypothetical protein